MDLEELRQKLITAARSNPPGDEVPRAFAMRLVARLPTRAASDFCSVWAAALWRAAAPCAAIMLLLGAWSWTGQTPLPQVGSDWSQDFDNTVMAAAELEQNNDFSW